MNFRLKNPPHPGAFVKSEIIEGYDLSVTDGAKALRVTRQALSELTNCRTALSADMALRLETVFGVSMDTLLRMQTSYEIAKARQRGTSKELQPYKPNPVAIRTGQQPSML